MNLFIKNFSYYLSPLIIKGIAGFIVQVPLITFYLNPKDLGTYYLIVGLLFLLTPLSDLGIDLNLQSNYFKRNSKNKKVYVFNLLFFSFLLTIFWGIIFFIILIILRDFFFFVEDNFHLFILTLGVYFFCFSNLVFKQVFALNKKPKLIFYAELFKITINLIILFILFKFYNLKISALLISLLITNFFSMFFEIFILRNYFIVNFKKNLILYNFFFGLKTISLNFIGMANFYLERLVVSFFYGLYVVGIYYHARTYYSFMTSAIKSLSMVYNPVLLKIKNLKDDKNFYFINLLNKHFLNLTFLAGIILVLLSKEIISILTHDKFTEAYMIVNIGYFTAINSVFYSFVSGRLIALKKINVIVFTGNLVQILFIFFIILISYFFEFKNILIIISAYVLSNFISSILRYYSLKKEKIYFNKLFLNFIIINLFYLLIIIIEKNIYLDLQLKLGIVLIILLSIAVYYHYTNNNIIKILNASS